MFGSEKLMFSSERWLRDTILEEARKGEATAAGEKDGGSHEETLSRLDRLRDSGRITHAEHAWVAKRLLEGC
jgi:hypothetical protein